jgi:DNA-directed RNA polymerase specialized sigma24 family protein
VRIVIQPNRSEQARQLAQRHPNLTPDDIAQTTGLKLRAVKAALARGRRDKPKSRVR